MESSRFVELKRTTRLISTQDYTNLHKMTSQLILQCKQSLRCRSRVVEQGSFVLAHIQNSNHERDINQSPELSIAPTRLPGSLGRKQGDIRSVKGTLGTILMR